MSGIRLAAAMLLLGALAACGGGGGGGGGNGNDDGLSVSPTSLTFPVQPGDDAPIQRTVTATVTNSAATLVGVGDVPGLPRAAWLNVTGGGSPPTFTFTFTASHAGLQAGTYTTSVRIGIGSDPQTLLAYRDVAMTMTIPAMLTTSASGVSFHHIIGAPAAPATKAVTVGGNTSIAWTATASQPWVTLSAANGTTPSTTSIGVNPSGLAPGLHSATVTFTGAGTTKAVNVTFSVAAPTIAPSVSQLSFRGINGATLAEQSLTLALDNAAAVSWTATSSAPWLVLSASSGTTPQTITVSVNPAIGRLASGLYQATIAIDAAHSGPSLHTVVNVSLQLNLPTLTASLDNIRLGGADGSDTSAQSIQLTLNTGGNSFPWTLTNLVAEAVPSAVSGTVSATPLTVTFQPSTTVVGGGYFSLSTFVATVNGDTVMAPIGITVLIKPHRLFVHDTGVALLSSPTLSRLTAAVTVRDNRGIPAPWTATSDQAWLTVTNASGTTPASFQMTANPASLPTDAISYANVTVTSSDHRVTNTEIVRVGLYKTATAPAAQSSASVVGATMHGIVADPVRPYVYVSHGTTNIDAYNIYTGALVQTLTAAGTSKLGSLAVDDDGGRLYALDHDTLSIRVFDIDAGLPAAIANWTDADWSNCQGCSGPFAFADLDYTRINGRGMLVGGGVHLIDASTGQAPRHLEFSFFASGLAGSVSGDGSKSFWAGLGSSGHTVTRKTQFFNELNDFVSFGEPPLGDLPLSVSKDGASRGLSTDYAGEVAYRACWFEDQQIESYDGATLATIQLVDNGTNGGAIVGPDDLVYCARYYDNFSGADWPDVWAVDPATGDVVAGREYNVADTVMERQFVISGDGLRLLTRSQIFSSSSGTLTSTTIAP